MSAVEGYIANPASDWIAVRKLPVKYIAPEKHDPAIAKPVIRHNIVIAMGIRAEFVIESYVGGIGVNMILTFNSIVDLRTRI